MNSFITGYFLIESYNITHTFLDISIKLFYKWKNVYYYILFFFVFDGYYKYVYFTAAPCWMKPRETQCVIKVVLHFVKTRKLRERETRRSITQNHVADAVGAGLFAERDSMTTFLSFKRSNGHARTRVSRRPLAFLVRRTCVKYYFLSAVETHDISTNDRT